MANLKQTNKHEEHDFLDQQVLQSQYSKAEHFVSDNRNIIFGVLGLLILVLLIIFGFRNVYLPGQQKEASAEMFKAQQYFQADSFRLALNGDGNYPGFLDIIDNYSGMTNAVNLANYYAGISYLNLGDYDNAISYLNDYDGSGDAVSSMALGALGDAYSQKGNMDKAISFYKKAANNNDNAFTAPMFLMKAGAALELQGKPNEALELYKKIKSDYSDSDIARDIDKFITRAQAA